MCQVTRVDRGSGDCGLTLTFLLALLDASSAAPACEGMADATAEAASSLLLAARAITHQSLTSAASLSPAERRRRFEKVTYTKSVLPGSLGMPQLAAAVVGVVVDELVPK